MDFSKRIVLISGLKIAVDKLVINKVKLKVDLPKLRHFVKIKNCKDMSTLQPRIYGNQGRKAR